MIFASLADSLERVNRTKTGALASRRIRRLSRFFYGMARNPLYFGTARLRQAKLGMVI
jgi:hypothetical protein